MNQVFLPHYKDCDGMFWCGIDDKVRKLNVGKR
jgi:hypothetical protein